MAFDPSVRVVRELIRATMRELKIEHESTDNHIWAVSYAQQPLASIRYRGPLCFTIEGAVLKVAKHRPMNQPHGYHYSNARRYASCLTSFDTISLPLSDPDFDVRLRTLLDDSLPLTNRRPAAWKQIMESSLGQYYLPDVPDEHPPKSLGSQIAAAMFPEWVQRLVWAFKALRGWRPPQPPAKPVAPIDEDKRLLEHALRRHFRVDAAGIAAVLGTVMALRQSGLSPEAIEAQTVEITER